ncbi:hypothetical protein CG723_41980 [Streptomyces sp. CB01635]|uniref:helix-turn-helix domain-containing protein n=1 Tax=unclassified Streptomyces TaxID=2593676 RepID=UPI000C27D473|nr:hypothetical protein CG723_41980 [Streptomyces sp. CB01635]
MSPLGPRTAVVFTVTARASRPSGYDQTTVDEITEAADVARGAFFNHFQRKEAHRRMGRTAARTAAPGAEGRRP